jgi:putative DNA primase/helicase
VLTIDDLPPVRNAKVAQVWAMAGCAVVPWRYQGDGKRRRKRPTIKGWTNGSAFTAPEQVKEHWAEHPDYPGIVTGPASGVWVLDLDGAEGVATIKRLMAEHGQEKFDERVLRVRTPRGGWHYYFKWAEGVRNSQGKLGPGVDVRGQGGFAAAPGTITADGEYGNLPQGEVTWQEAPVWLLDLVRATPVCSSWEGTAGPVESTDALAQAQPGEQDQALFAFLAAQHRRGASEPEAVAAAWGVVRSWPLGDPTDPWTIEDVQEKGRSIWAREEFKGIAAPPEQWMRDVTDRFAGVVPAELPVVQALPASVEAVQNDDADDVATMADGFRATDAGNALRLIALANGRVRYVHAWHKWLVYIGGRWVLDHGDVLMQRWAKEVARSLFRRGEDERLDSSHREAMAKFGLRSESMGHMASMIKAARDIPGVLVEHNDLDAKPWLLNCLNGTVDLKTGQLREHDPDDLLMMQVPVVYDPAVRSPLWEKVVAEWLPDEDVRAFMKRAVGSAATGVAVQALIVNHGDGGNGKTTFFKVINLTLGEHCVQPDDSLIVTGRNEPHPTVKASLFRARMLLVAETSAGAKLNEQQVKLLTGGDVIRARRMREDEWSFEPTHTAFMHSNHEPRIKGTDEGIWRRVKLVPWTVTIPDERKDQELEAKLKLELSGVLTWIVEGAIEWAARSQNLGEPAAVLDATARFRGKSDTVATFLRETGVTTSPTAWVTTGELMDVHRQWVQAAGLGIDEAAHYKLVTEHLREHGADSKLKRIAGQPVRVWTGVGLTEPDALVDRENV